MNANRNYFVDCISKSNMFIQHNITFKYGLRLGWANEISGNSLCSFIHRFLGLVVLGFVRQPIWNWHTHTHKQFNRIEQIPILIMLNWWNIHLAFIFYSPISNVTEINHAFSNYFLFLHFFLLSFYLFCSYSSFIYLKEYFFYYFSFLFFFRLLSYLAFTLNVVHSRPSFSYFLSIFLNIYSSYINSVSMPNSLGIHILRERSEFIQCGSSFNRTRNRHLNTLKSVLLQLLCDTSMN